MARVLIVHASRHGSTAGIAVRIGEVLRSEGVDATVESARGAPDPAGFDACVVGGAVYMGSWQKEGVDFLERYRSTLAGMPVWLFSSGPLPGSTQATAPTDDALAALGPAEGPGSGGRKRIEALAAAIQPREHRVLEGAFDPTIAPASMSERLVRMMPAAKQILPAGDFREWDVIEGWARQIAAALKEPVQVA